jgi:hypothetical protein
MRRVLLLVCAAGALAISACQEHTHTERSTADPVPIRMVVLLDVEGMQGGQNLWLSEDGTGVAQVVGHGTGRGLPEKRYRVRFAKAAVTEAERLVGTRRFLALNLELGVGVPGGGHPCIAVVTKDGRQSTSIKREHDKHPDFDPLYGHLLGLSQVRDGAELIHEGIFDWDWHPEGFPSLKEIRDWPK